MDTALLNTLNFPGEIPLSPVVDTLDRDLGELIERAKDEWFDRVVAGPKHLRWSELPPQIGDPAPNLNIQDTAGTSRQLSEFWADGPALLLFWRHFGCGCGIARAEQLAEEYHDYVEAGATVAVIGDGDPERGAVYKDEYDIACPVLCDPDGTAHDSFGLRDFSVSQVWYGLPDDLLERYRSDPERVGDEISSDHRADGRPKVDNEWRQPGEFVVDENGTLHLTYRYQYCEDFPDSRVLTTAIRTART